MIRLRLLVLLVPALLLQACSTYKKSALFQDAEKYRAQGDSASAKLDLNEMRIQRYDVLKISASSAFKALEDITTQGPKTQSVPTVYTVSPNGTVELADIGEVQVEGLTLKEAEDKLKVVLSKYLVNPHVDVSFLTFKINVFGEVYNPGVKAIPTESANLLDALSMGGGIKETGDVTSVKITRQTKSGVVVYFIDLTKIDALYQPGYMLMPNDLVYVQPVKRKFLISNAAAISAVAAVLNVTVALLQGYSLIRNNSR